MTDDLSMEQMTIKDTRAASFRIESDKWLAFVDKAKENNTDSSKLLREWIDQYLASDGDQDEDKQLIDEDAIRAIVRIEIENQLDKSNENKIAALQQPSPNNEEVLSLTQRIDELEKKLFSTAMTA